LDLSSKDQDQDFKFVLKDSLRTRTRTRTTTLEEGECGDDEVEELLVRKRRSLDILSVKKEARLLARALAEVQVSRGEEELRCNSLFIHCVPKNM